MRPLLLLVAASVLVACGGKVRSDAGDLRGDGGGGGANVGEKPGSFPPATGVIASELDTPRNLVVSKGTIYFSDGQKLLSCPTSGCGSHPTRLAVVDSYISSVATSGVDVYFTTNDAVYSFPIGGPVGVLRKMASELPRPRGISWDPDRSLVYWVNAAGDVQRCERECSAGPTTLVSGERDNPYAVIAKGDDLLWTTEGADTATGGGRLRRCSLSVPSCTPETLADGQNFARTLVANDATIFWVADGESTVRACSRPACTDVRELPLAGQTGLAIDGENVYWSFFASGWVQSCPLAGCIEPMPIAEQLAGPGSIALDDQYVYIATSDGAILARPK